MVTEGILLSGLFCSTVSLGETLHLFLTKLDLIPANLERVFPHGRTDDPTHANTSPPSVFTTINTIRYHLIRPQALWSPTEPPEQPPQTVTAHAAVTQDALQLCVSLLFRDLKP